jgi:ABC-type transporter Mla subunit MlaD
MPRTPEWKDLTVGLIAIGAVAAFVVVILLFAGVGDVRGRKVTLYVVAQNAGGVLRNTEVKVAGKLAGAVRDVRLREPSSDTAERVLIEAAVLERALPLLRRDSYAEIRPSGTIIGAPIVDIAAGSASSPVLREGDTIRTRIPLSAESVAARVEKMGKEFGGVMREWRSITADIRTARGTFGAVSAYGPRDFAAFRARAAALGARVTSGRGSVGLAMSDRELQRRTSRVLATVDTIGRLLESGSGSIGRFRSDPTLINEMELAKAELTAIRATLAEARGTAGRVREDRALAIELEELSQELERLIEDVKGNPFRYLRF